MKSKDHFRHVYLEVSHKKDSGQAGMTRLQPPHDIKCSEMLIVALYFMQKRLQNSAITVNLM